MNKNLSVEEKKTAIEAIRSLADLLGIDLKECLENYPQFGWHVLNDGTVVPPEERDWSLIRGIWSKNGYCINIDLLHKQRMYKYAVDECKDENSYIAPQDIYDLIRDNLATFNHSLELIGKKPLSPDILYWMKSNKDDYTDSAPAYNMLHGMVSSQATIRDMEYLAVFLHEPIK